MTVGAMINAEWQHWPTRVVRGSTLDSREIISPSISTTYI